MAKYLQLVGDFPSSGVIDEEKIKQLVEEYLRDNPPAASITINGGASDENGTAKAVMSVCATVGSKLSDLVIKDGQLIFIQDRHKIALDFDGKRTFYNQIEELATDADRISMTAPEAGLFYFVIETAVLWTYLDKWVPVTTPPQEIVFIGTELPELGAARKLYVNTNRKEISIWDDETDSYIVVADKTAELTADDIDALFQKI